ncbi:MAG: TIGR02530 family flagellar biosynthesis protein [Chloroflexota bacterium]
MDELNPLPGINGAIPPVAPGGVNPGRGSHNGQPAGQAFDAVLRDQLLRQDRPGPPVTFSAHAQQRLQQRDITLGDQAVAKITDAVDRARQKGSKESLILLDDMAFVVSVKNRVVITAVDQPSMKQNVFTNIDSVVIA